MTDYQKMYTTLFNAVTDALEKMEVQNYGDAKELLISAQQKTEEIYITAQKHRLTRAHREKQLKMSCQALHNAPPNRT